MGFRINTNIAALNSHTNATLNNRSLDNALSKLSSGLRINTAADDASGMAIADSLRSQANSLGQAISNSNDAIGLIQTADKAMDEQLKILDTIKTKAIQAASDTQTTSSRSAIQKDVNRLIEQLDNIAKTTSFNGQVLLSGKYTNKEFQIGAFSNQTIKASINNTQSLAIGNIQTKTDIVELGNTYEATLAASILKDTEKIDIAQAFGATGLSIAGLAIGSKIRIDGVGDYIIKGFGGVSLAAANISSGYMTGGTLILDKGLEKAITAGNTFRISIVDETARDFTKLAMSPGTIHAFSDGSSLVRFTDHAFSEGETGGFAVGDQVQFKTSEGIVFSLRVAGLSSGQAGSAALVFSSGALAGSGVSAALITNATIVGLVKQGELGTNFTSSDYIQYTVEGTKLTGIQLTDDKGNGVVGSGLGRVADLINETTEVSGIKAVALVEKTSKVKVSEGTLADDLEINGIKILNKGTAIKEGDSDGALVNSINAKSSITGVKASTASDGSLTLTSDGRAMNVKGLSGNAGISDGVYAGKLSLTKNGLEIVNVSSQHFKDAALTAVSANANTLTEIEDKLRLQDLVIGKTDVDQNGVIDDKDPTGMLMSKEGAMKAMNIVETALKTLDATRADLGSVQNQLVVTVNNISVTQVNVKAAESTLRDVDFAAESANFSKYNILAQSGSYAMSQANAIQQNVLRLLQ